MWNILPKFRTIKLSNSSCLVLSSHHYYLWTSKSHLILPRWTFRMCFRSLNKHFSHDVALEIFLFSFPSFSKPKRKSHERNVHIEFCFVFMSDVCLDVSRCYASIVYWNTFFTLFTNGSAHGICLQFFSFLKVCARCVVLFKKTHFIDEEMKKYYRFSHVSAVNISKWKVKAYQFKNHQVEMPEFWWLKPNAAWFDLGM